MAGFSLTDGLLRVLSGPCQLIRSTNGLDPRFLDMLFSLLNESPSNLGMLDAHFRLAEDVPFTHFVYITSGKRVDVAFDAKFDMDPCLTLEEFFGQRR
eukprot:gene23323-28223_t